MDLIKKIEEIRPTMLNCNIFSIYDYPESYTITELLCEFFTKINSCIKSCNDTFDMVKWLVDEGIKIEVAKKLQMWLEDGTLGNLINETLFKELNEKINGKVDIIKMPSKCIEDFGAVGDGITDDTQSFIKALKSSKSVYLISDKKYVISEKIIMDNYTMIEGHGATIKYVNENSNIVLGKGCIIKDVFTLVDTNIELNEAVFTFDGNIQYNVGFNDTPSLINVSGEQMYNDGQKRSTFIHLKGEQANAFKQCYISGVSLQNIKCIRFKFGVKITCSEVEGTSFKTYVTSTQLNNFHAFNCENFIYEYEPVGKKASIGGNIYTNCHFQPIDNGYHVYLHNTGNGNIIRDCDFWDNSRCTNTKQLIIKSNNNVISGGKLPPFDTEYWDIQGNYNFIMGHTYGTPSSFVPVLVADRNIYRYFNKSKKTTPFIYNILSNDLKSSTTEKSINKIDLDTSQLQQGHNVLKFKNFGTGLGSNTTIDFNLKINGKALINGNLTEVYSNTFEVDCIIDIRKYADYNEIKSVMKVVVASGKIYIFNGKLTIRHEDTTNLNFDLLFKSSIDSYLTNNYAEIEMITQ